MKPKKYPKELYVTWNYEDVDRGEEPILCADEDLRSVSDGDQIAVYKFLGTKKVEMRLA